MCRCIFMYLAHWNGTSLPRDTFWIPQMLLFGVKFRGPSGN